MCYGIIEKTSCVRKLAQRIGGVMNVEKFREDFNELICSQGDIDGEDMFGELYYYATIRLLQECPCNFVALRIVHESIGVALETYKKELIDEELDKS